MSTGEFELIEDELGVLTFRRPAEDDVKDVRIRRAFPWSSPSRFISIRSSEGKELLLIDDVNALPAELRGRIERWLASNSFIPKITRIEQIDTRFGYQQWRIQTDHGPAEFRVQEREDIRFMPDGRFSVKDADGNVYELPHLDKLDEASRKALEALV
jgi:Domain of unknown function (DUF1854)